MTVHKLKTWPEYFIALEMKRKPFEVRKDDRSFCVGDTLLLQEWDNRRERYTGREVEAEVTYLLRGGQFGVEPGYVVMGLFL